MTRFVTSLSTAVLAATVSFRRRLRPRRHGARREAGAGAPRAESVARRYEPFGGQLQRAAPDGVDRARPARADYRHDRIRRQGRAHRQGRRVIDVNRIDTQNEKRDGHLRSPDFFDAANHPNITFKSKRVEPGTGGAFKLIGDLTIRGTTKEVALDVEAPAPVVKGMAGSSPARPQRPVSSGSSMG